MFHFFSLRQLFLKTVWVVFSLFLFGTIQAQIIITENDFADANDTARMSQAVWNPLLDFSATGAAYTWDFSTLQWQSQYVDEFLSPYSTGISYSIIFPDIPFAPYRSNIAQKADNILTSFPVLNTIFTDGINFYYKSSSMYRQRGIGMKVSGFSTPIPMTHADTLYRFPMDYGHSDSSWSDYTVRIPQLGTYTHRQHRVNKVDGWGTLTTPFGTFDVLRVRTEIRGSDSLYVDSLQFGFKINNDIQREYKWFGKNQMEPLLQINTQAGILNMFPNFEYVTKVVYRDSVRFLPTGFTEKQPEDLGVNLFPNPSSGSFYISLPQALLPATFTLTNLSGQNVWNDRAYSTTVRIDAPYLPKGFYLLSIKSNQSKMVKRVLIQ